MTIATIDEVGVSVELDDNGQNYLELVQQFFKVVKQ